MTSSARAPFIALILLCGGMDAVADDRRVLGVDDLFTIEEVSDPQISPEGDQIVYTISRLDLASDKGQADLVMTSWDGARTVQLTHSPGVESQPRFSPDGRWIAFLSARDDEDEADQVWLLDRAGGEADRVTDLRGGVSDFVWSPDGRSLALVVLDPESNPCEADGDTPCTPAPIVIDRYKFKEDEVGYLGARREHLVRFDLDGRVATPLTSGPYDDALPAWSPDGRSVAFVSKRAGADPDRGLNWDLYVVDAVAGATPWALTTFNGADDHPEWETRPAWSPDGAQIAYLQGGPPKFIYYELPKLAVVPVAGGAPRVVTGALDRALGQVRWSQDGRSVYATLEDDGSVSLVRISVSSGKVVPVAPTARAVEAFDVGRGDRLAVLNGSPQRPAEVYTVRGSSLRPLSRRNDALLASLRLGATEQTRVTSPDGTSVTSFVVRPPDYEEGKRYPTLLHLHGGPVGQFGNDFNFQAQLFAAHGYVVVSPNPRGSSGRGEAFTRAIYADWGHLDAQDVLAAVDDVVARGLADPDRLGVGGWSYGGMLTDAVIAQDTRFKAATSGASIANILAGYGTDQYVVEYEAELGTPWANPDVYMHNSLAFLHADRIKTPTLFLCGESDFNVPLINSEQMYQALRSLGVETQLVIYPGQPHAITTPSYQKDRAERYLAWFGRFLAP